MRRYHVLNAEPAEGAAVDAAHITELQERLLELKGVMSVKQFFSGWFLGAPFESLKRGNIEDFIAYGFYCKRPDELAPEARQQLSEYIDRIEEVWDVCFKEGHTPGLRFMAHLWEDLRYMHKPLAVHLAAEAMGLLTAVMLLALGFRMRRMQGFTYWVRGAPPTEAVLAGAGAAAAAAAPLVFIHGVGLGLTPYLHFIAELLRAFPGRPVVLLETRAALVQSMVLVDPVCMLTIYPQLLHNFVYRTFHPCDGVIDSLRYAFSRDLVIAAVFGRKFVWHRMCLWPADLPPASLAVLSAGDDLVPSRLIAAQLEQHGSPCQVLVHPTAPHGGFLLDSKFRRQMLHAMERTLAAGAAPSAKAA
ncbi:hypothetical protein WJX81_000194 [Elliptochloris bilobata]|uniref:Uncharacterized protein n=1 Tax=Elliptochloris bilobata TaxID=381761 RepID=A0AAW1S7Y5_9CHLO